jgi:hypothetical protein
MFRRNLPPFSSPHLMTSGYLCHQRRLLNLDECCHCWSNSYKYGAMNIGDNNTCNNDGCSRENTIIRQTNIKRWLHSPCYWDVWVYSFLFWFIFYHLCTNHYHTSLVVFFSPLDACFLLLTTHVHNLVACTSHNDFLASCCTWSKFLIFSTHHS